MARGPLAGVRVLEFAGIGPGPFCGMLLADMGADVVRVDRAGDADSLAGLICGRGKRSVALDLKNEEGRAAAVDLIGASHALIEGFRPGVMERLGLGPEPALQRNPALVYGRMTGWGQEGPLARRAGHDINYIGLSGALAAIGPADQPIAPLNLVGDFGGGALYLALGVVAALWEARASGAGQVVDCAMVDGSASLMTQFYQLHTRGMWGLERGANLLDGGLPYYRTYACADGKWMTVGALEPQFYRNLLAALELDLADFPQDDRSCHERLTAALTERFASRTRDEWAAHFAGIDACVGPVLDMVEAPVHAFNAERANFVELDGGWQPAPAPRFSRTATAVSSGAPQAGQHTDAVFAEWLSSDGPAARAGVNP